MLNYCIPWWNKVVMGPTFHPRGVFLFPTLDRGSKLFGGRDGYESKRMARRDSKLPWNV